jgi:hypothetical protein
MKTDVDFVKFISNGHCNELICEKDEMEETEKQEDAQEILTMENQVRMEAPVVMEAVYFSFDFVSPSILNGKFSSNLKCTLTKFHTMFPCLNLCV